MPENSKFDNDAMKYVADCCCTERYVYKILKFIPLSKVKN